ncbi:MAG: hypothetical protein M1833_000520 [Piccolia ochrophora]|nr:MAG: hypothetical protein M1833_000520 [Piccolia ochrophora]
MALRATWTTVLCLPLLLAFYFSSFTSSSSPSPARILPRASPRPSAPETSTRADDRDGSPVPETSRLPPISWIVPSDTGEYDPATRPWDYPPLAPPGGHGRRLGGPTYPRTDQSPLPPPHPRHRLMRVSGRGPLPRPRRIFLVLDMETRSQEVRAVFPTGEVMAHQTRMSLFIAASKRYGRRNPRQPAMRIGMIKLNRHKWAWWSAAVQVEVFDAPENDDYVPMAGEIRRGHIVRTVSEVGETFHPNRFFFDPNSGKGLVSDWWVWFETIGYDMARLDVRRPGLTSERVLFDTFLAFLGRLTGTPNVGPRWTAEGSDAASMDEAGGLWNQYMYGRGSYLHKKVDRVYYITHGATRLATIDGANRRPEEAPIMQTWDISDADHPNFIPRLSGYWDQTDATHETFINAEYHPELRPALVN